MWFMLMIGQNGVGKIHCSCIEAIIIRSNTVDYLQKSGCALEQRYPRKGNYADNMATDHEKVIPNLRLKFDNFKG